MKYDKFKQLVNYAEESAGHKAHSSAEDILNFEKIKPKIFYRLVSGYEKEKFEERCPYIPFFDMAIMFRWLFHEDEDGISSALIERKHLDCWGIDEHMLVKIAITNTPKMFAEHHCRILEAINHWTNIEGPDLPLYIFTNRIGINGASVIFYRNILKTFADKIDQNFYILPSSIHEVLIIGENEVTCTQDLKNMVLEANHTVVTPKEFLSNQVMYYDREKDEIKIVP
jgi:hypothetical protein